MVISNPPWALETCVQCSVLSVVCGSGAIIVGDAI